MADKLQKVDSAFEKEERKRTEEIKRES